MGLFIEGGPYVRKYGIQKLELEVVKNLKRYMTSTDIKKLPVFMVYVLVSQELGPIFQVNPRDMGSY